MSSLPVCHNHLYRVVRETWWPYLVYGVCVHCGHWTQFDN